MFCMYSLGPLPSCGYDDPWLRHDSGDLSLLVRLQWCQILVQKNYQHFQTVLRTAQLTGLTFMAWVQPCFEEISWKLLVSSVCFTCSFRLFLFVLCEIHVVAYCQLGPLWFWDESCKNCDLCCWKLEEGKSWYEWGLMIHNNCMHLCTAVFYKSCWTLFCSLISSLSTTDLKPSTAEQIVWFMQELICLRAIRDVNVPKFLQDDLKLFNGIVSDLFPKIREEPIDYGTLEESIRNVCATKCLKDVDCECAVELCNLLENNIKSLLTELIMWFYQLALNIFYIYLLQCYNLGEEVILNAKLVSQQIKFECFSWLAAFITKCIQLYETTVVRHGLMLVGPSGSGKTKVRFTSTQTRSQMNKLQQKWPTLILEFAYMCSHILVVLWSAGSSNDSPERPTLS